MKAPLWLKYGSVIKRNKSRRKWSLELMLILFLFWITTMLQILTVYSLCWHKDWLKHEYLLPGPEPPKTLHVK